MWPSDRPLPIGRDAVPLDERHERALVAAHDLERVVGAALVLPHEHRRDRLAVRVDGHDRRVLAAHRHRDDVGGVRRMRGGDLAHRVDELVPHLDRVLLGGVRRRGSTVSARCVRADRRGRRRATSATFRLVVPTSIPIAYAIGAFSTDCSESESAGP